MEKSKVYTALCVDIDGSHTVKFVVAMSLPHAVDMLVHCDYIKDIINVEQLPITFKGVLN